MSSSTAASSSSSGVDASTQQEIAAMQQAQVDGAAFSAKSAQVNEALNEQNQMAKAFGSVGQ
jgi:hypothetical protein